MEALWRSVREFTTGPVALVAAGVSGLLTLLAVIQTVRGSSGWMWAFFAALALTVLAFWAFHRMRGKLSDAEDALAEVELAQVGEEETGPRVEFGPPMRIRARIDYPETQGNDSPLNEVLVVPVWNMPHHEEDAPALNVHVRADVTYPSSGLQSGGWTPTWLEDLPSEEFEPSSPPSPPEVTLPSNGRKFYVVVMAIFIEREECREWTREGAGRPIEDQFGRDDNYSLRLLVNSSNGGPRQVGHEIEYQWPYVHIDNGRTFSAWH